MRTDRRGFLRTLASALAILGVRPGRAGAAGTADDSHWATRNTRWGAIGLRRPQRGPAQLPWKPYVGRPRIALPPPSAGPGLALDAGVVAEAVPAGGFSGAPIRLADLSRILHYSNGLTPVSDAHRRAGSMRAAPSAGALYAGELYVVALRVADLAPGAYYYDVVRHALVGLETDAGSSAFERAAEAFETPALLHDAAALVLLGNVFERYRWRYGNRGYRYALIDSGHIGENLVLSTRSAGLQVRAFERFHDDALALLLALDGVREPICAVWALGAAGPGRPAAPVRRFVQRGYAAQPGLEDLPSEMERHHEASKLLPLEGPLAAGEPAGPPAWQAEPVHSASRVLGRTRLPAPVAPLQISVEAAIEGRRSASEFHAHALDPRLLRASLELATRPWAGGDAPGLDLLVAAHRVGDLAPGLYRWDAAERELELLQSGSLADRMVRVCLGQEMAGSAAVGCLLVARLGEGRARARDRSYRDLLIAAGALAERLYLAAEAGGLVARNLAAFVDDELNQLLGLDGSREGVVHLTMLGPGR